MTHAILQVTTINQAELRFMLQQPNQPATMMRQYSQMIGPSLRGHIERSLQRFANCEAGRHSDEPLFQGFGQVLFAQILPQALRQQIRDLNQPLAIWTDDPTLPWEIMHDGNEFLAFKVPVSRQLMIHHQLQMGGLLQRPQPERGEFAALVISDPLDNLPGARAEGRALYKLFNEIGTCELLEGKDATWDNIQIRLVRRSYAVIHYCGHMEYDPTSRTSFIYFQGSNRLAADEVTSVFRGSPIVFLNACRSDPQPQHDANLARGDFGRGAESFAKAFMLGNEQGLASAVIGTMWLVLDNPNQNTVEAEQSRLASQEMMGCFYRALFDGQPLAEAMQACRRLAREKLWGPAAWSPYVMYGDPCLCPFPKLEPPSPPPPRTEETNAGDPAVKATRGMTLMPASASDTKVHVPAPNEPPSSESQPEKEDSSFDDSARQVLLLSLREMSQAGHKSFGSLHLLIGLCRAKLAVLEDAADAVFLDAACIAVRARKLGRGQAQEGSGISKSVLEAFKRAMKHARSQGRKRTRGDDLLLGLLGCKCSAIQVLETFGIDHAALAERLRNPPSDPLGNWSFDAQARKCLEVAVRTARQAYRDFLGTPHLLIGLCEAEGSWTADFLARQGMDVARVCRHLAREIGEGESRKSGPLTLRDRVVNVLNRAGQHARSHASESISELDLLRSILEEKDGATREVLVRLEGNPDVLLEKMSQGS